MDKDMGTALFLIGLGLLVGYVSITGKWNLVFLSLFYPSNIQINK